MKLHPVTDPLALLAGLAARVPRPIVIERATGVLTVRHGRVWVTQLGEGGDRVLDAGDRLRLMAARGVVIETWRSSEAAHIDWQPDVRLQDRVAARLRTVLRGAAAGALGALAWLAGAVASGLRRGEGAFAALARSAASSARRAQGCI